MTRFTSRIRLVLVVVGVAKAAFEPSIPSAADIATGDGQVAWSPEGGARNANPALIAVDSGWNVGAGITHPIGLSDLNLSGLWLGRGAWRFVPAWAFRWEALQAGDLYREDLLSLDIGTGESRWQIGGGLRAGRTLVSQGNAQWIYGFAVGAKLQVHSLVSIGGSWEDLSGIASPNDRWAQPWNLRMGLAASPADSLWASAISLEKRQNFALCWKFGQELRWKILRLRAGVRLEPWVVSYGAGIRWEGLGLDWAQEGDSRLGWQQHWTISVLF